MIRTTFLLLLCLLTAGQADAQLQLGGVFTDNMVLQRNAPLAVWGWGTPRQNVAVSFAGRSATDKADKDGYWLVELPAMGANVNGRPLTVVQGGQTVQLDNVVVGDVWVCSGQSNMQWLIKQLDVAQQVAEQADDPLVRLMTVSRDLSVFEADRLPPCDPWAEAVGTAVYDFSAVAYFFGLHLHQQTQVPIGLIATSWGGTNVEAWMPPHKVKEFDALQKVLDRYQDQPQRGDFEATMALWEEKMAAVLAQTEGTPGQWQQPQADLSAWQTVQAPMDAFLPELEEKDGVVWFRKTFEVPLPFRGKDLELRLGKLDDYDAVWVNGTKVGEQKWANHGRRYVIPKEVLKPTGNEVVIRLVDYGGQGGWKEDPYHVNMYPVGDSNGWYLLSGDWLYRVDQLFDQPMELPKVERYEARLANKIPSSLYNRMIHPLLELPIAGAIWYQGESNGYGGYEYRTHFPAMIAGWRDAFDQGDFPFLYVQLANWNARQSPWPELRQAQAEARKLPNTAMAVAIDIGEGDNIHPQNKQDVGKRLALGALNLYYEQDVPFLGPDYKSHAPGDKGLLVTFDHVGDGLQLAAADDGSLFVRGFELLDAQGNVYPASAMIVSQNQVKVWHPDVPNPTGVRYAWQNNPEDLNLYNSHELPAEPFHSEPLPWTSQGNVYNSN